MSIIDRKICFCGASTWCKVLACFHTMTHTLLLTALILAHVVVGAIMDSENRESDNRFYNAVFIALLAYSLVGIFMGILLLKGTREARVAYLRAWFIWGVVSMVLLLFVTAYDLRSTGGLLLPYFTTGLAVTIATIAIVAVHKKDIEGGARFGTEMRTSYLLSEPIHTVVMQ